MASRNGVCLLVGLLVLGGAPTKASAPSGKRPWMPTADEMRRLPNFCQDRLRYGLNRKNNRIAHWYRVFGPDFVHSLHYCTGLNFMSRAQRLLDTGQRKFELERAERQFTYIVEKARPEFALVPPSYVLRARARRELGRTNQAISDCRTAIRVKEDYIPAYLELARILRGLGRREEAAEALERGLARNPGSRALKRALASLKGAGRPTDEP